MKRAPQIIDIFQAANSHFILFNAEYRYIYVSKQIVKILFIFSMNKQLKMNYC